MDGKLAGILRPNDGKCYMNKDGYYYKSAYQDYPSVSHINMTAQSVSILFDPPISSLTQPYHYLMRFEPN